MARPSLWDEVSCSFEIGLRVSYSLVMVLGEGLPGSEIGGLRETRHCERWYGWCVQGWWFVSALPSQKLCDQGRLSTKSKGKLASDVAGG